MLIDFTVENYRSIKEPVTLSFVAQRGRSVKTANGAERRNVKPDTQIAQVLSIEGRGIDLLPAVGIFGANASGKSNVVRALDDVLTFINIGSAIEKVNLLHRFTPFKLDEEAARSPSRFELRIARHGMIFTYILSIDGTRIIHERLEHVPPPPRRKLNRLIFDRVWQPDQQVYGIRNGSDFGDGYKEIQESLRDHEPFVSFLIRRLKVEVVSPLADWIRQRWPSVGLGKEEFDHNLSAQLLGERAQVLESVTELVRSFDTGIFGIDIEKRDTSASGAGEIYDTWVRHKTDSGVVRWPLEEESTGTHRLFSLAYKMIDSLYYGSLVIVDELGSNIHPNITREIVRMYQDTELNKKGAQLLFTSHDNTLQRGNLLRRDQIWFTQKREDGSTELYPLTDFRPRNDLAIDKAYLEGRFGAVPILPSEEELISSAGKR
jgi:AAA15 family ATPase/GTPase